MDIHTISHNDIRGLSPHICTSLLHAPLSLNKRIVGFPSADCSSSCIHFRAASHLCKSKDIPWDSMRFLQQWHTMFVFAPFVTHKYHSRCTRYQNHQNVDSSCCHLLIISTAFCCTMLYITARCPFPPLPQMKHDQRQQLLPVTELPKLLHCPNMP